MSKKSRVDKNNSEEELKKVEKEKERQLKKSGDDLAEVKKS
jgi:hypothetical protein